MIHSGHNILIGEIYRLVFNWGLFKSEVSPREVGLNGQQHPEILECPWSVFDHCVTFENQSSLSAPASCTPRVAPIAEPKMERPGSQNGHKVRTCLLIPSVLSVHNFMVFRHLKLNIFYWHTHFLRYNFSDCQAVSFAYHSFIAWSFCVAFVNWGDPWHFTGELLVPAVRTEPRGLGLCTVASQGLMP